MREILFRGQRIDNWEWCVGHLLRYDGGRARIVPSYTDIYCYKNDKNTIVTIAYEVIPSTVCQYTELTDKNGTKIFEGDIVNILPEVDEIGVIEWADDEAMFTLNADGWCANFDNYLPEDVEVIGNIHDNPELLGGES